jgi:hypothetical protein
VKCVKISHAAVVVVQDGDDMVDFTRSKTASSMMSLLCVAAIKEGARSAREHVAGPMSMWRRVWHALLSVKSKANSQDRSASSIVIQGRNVQSGNV